MKKLMLSLVLFSNCLFANDCSFSICMDGFANDFSDRLNEIQRKLEEIDNDDDNVVFFLMGKYFGMIETLELISKWHLPINEGN